MTAGRSKSKIQLKLHHCVQERIKGQRNVQTINVTLETNEDEASKTPLSKPAAEFRSLKSQLAATKRVDAMDDENSH